MKTLSVLFFSFIISISACAQGQPELTEAQKESIKNFTFTNLDGKSVKLSDFEGKVVVIDFWETWCGPCLRFMPTLDKLTKDFSDDFVVLAASPAWQDSPDDVTSFVKEKNYNFNFVYAKELARELKIMGIPYKVFVAADGTVLKAQMGISGDENVDYNEVADVIKAHRSSAK